MVKSMLPHSKNGRIAAVMKEQLLPAKILDEPVSHTSLVTLGEKLELTSNQRVKYNSDVFKLTGKYILVFVSSRCF